MTEEYLMEKKVELLVDMKVKKLASQLELANKSIIELTAEVEILKNKVQRLNLGVSQPQGQQTLESGKEEAGSANTEPKKEASARTGNLTPDDVSVEKMFYFGNKS